METPFEVISIHMRDNYWPTFTPLCSCYKLTNCATLEFHSSLSCPHDFNAKWFVKR